MATRSLASGFHGILPLLYPYLLYFLDQTNHIVTPLTVCVALYTHSPEVTYFCAGALVCTMSAKALKRLLRQPRPQHCVPGKTSYGMPSAHSATGMFYGTYIPLACCLLHPSGGLRILLPLVILAWGYLVALSRVWLGYHTPKQVVAGCVYGCAFAGAWFKVWLWMGGMEGRDRFLHPLVDFGD